MRVFEIGRRGRVKESSREVGGCGGKWLLLTIRALVIVRSGAFCDEWRCVW